MYIRKKMTTESKTILGLKIYFYQLTPCQLLTDTSMESSNYISLRKSTMKLRKLLFSYLVYIFLKARVLSTNYPCIWGNLIDRKHRLA